MKGSYDVIQALRNALDGSRRARPRPKLPRLIGFYVDDRILNRPLFALNQLARVSEYALARSYLGLTPGNDELVTKHYERVQDAIKRLLEEYDPGALLSRDYTPVVRKLAKELLDRTRHVLYMLQIPWEKVERVPSKPAPKGNRNCPFCHGKGMTPDHIRLFKYALLKMIKVGMLPESFKIFA